MPNLVQDYQRLINQAIVELPGASDAGIRQALFEVLHEFFEETNSWQEHINVPVTAAVTGPYRLTIAEGGEYVRLMGLVNSKGTPMPATTDLLGVLTLRDGPNAAETFVATVSKTIGVPVDREGKPQVPDWTVARFEPIVSAGLIGRMMIQAKKPYSNPQMGQYWLKKFRNGLGKVKSAVIHGNLYSANTWRFPSGFRMSRTSQHFGTGGTDQSFGID